MVERQEDDDGCVNTKLEITSEMIEAGQRCLDELFDATVEVGSNVGLMCIPGGWAEAVFRAMWDIRNRKV